MPSIRQEPMPISLAEVIALVCLSSFFVAGFVTRRNQVGFSIAQKLQQYFPRFHYFILLYWGLYKVSCLKSLPGLAWVNNMADLSSIWFRKYCGERSEMSRPSCTLFGSRTELSQILELNNCPITCCFLQCLSFNTYLQINKRQVKQKRMVANFYFSCSWGISEHLA